MSPVRSKILRDRAKANAKRIGTHAIVNTLADTKSRKLVNAIASAAPAQEAEKGATERPWLVMVDSQGVAYLRVELLPKGARFLLNTGREIQVVELPEGTIRSRNLKAAPQASVLEAAKIFARPLTSSVIIGERSKSYLDLILNDEELKNMADKVKNTKKAAGKTAKSKTTKGTGAPRTPKVSIEERFAVAKKIIGAKKDGATRKEFTAGLKEVYPNFYSSSKRLLVEAGYIKVDKTTGNVTLAK